MQTTIISEDENRHVCGSQVSIYGDKFIVESRNQIELKAAKHANEWSEHILKEDGKMEWQIIVALIVAIPFILIPPVFVWYLNIGGIYAIIKEASAKKIAREKKTHEAAVTQHHTNS